MRIPTVVDTDEVVYKRFLSVCSRQVQYPGKGEEEDKTFDFDVVGHHKANFHFVCIFPISFSGDGKEPQVTILKEYCWGPDAVLYSLPTGSFDPQKHQTYEDCAYAELSEEAHLKGGEISRLLDKDHPGISEAKWCANRFTPFLVVNPERDDAPGEQEGEEFIEVLQVGIPELKGLLFSGNFMQPAFTTAMHSMKRLEEMGLL